jgi:hypothetical protein
MTKFYPILVETNAHGHAGKWAVASGNKNQKYYLTTVCDTEAEAKRQALLWMMRDAYQKCEELYAEGVEEGLFEPYSMGDYLC